MLAELGVESGGDIIDSGLTVTSLQEQHHREHKVGKKGPFADPDASGAVRARRFGCQWQGSVPAEGEMTR